MWLKLYTTSSCWMLRPVAWERQLENGTRSNLLPFQALVELKWTCLVSWSMTCAVTGQHDQSTLPSSILIDCNSKSLIRFSVHWLGGFSLNKRGSDLKSSSMQRPMEFHHSIVNTILVYMLKKHSSATGQWQARQSPIMFSHLSNVWRVTSQTRSNMEASVIPSKKQVYVELVHPHSIMDPKSG